MKDIKELEKILEQEPAFRLKQAREAVFKNLISNWDEALNFSPALREKMDKEFPLQIASEIFWGKEKEFAKAVLILEDNLKIESVLMRHRDGRNTVCVSSQAGCSMACAFCATGKMGFQRNLSDSEIIFQVLFFARELKKQNEKISNLVFMGMGEPFLNANNVFSAIAILKGEMGIGARKISISTCGIIPGIRELAKKEPQVNLAISLHAPDSEMRGRIMPVEKLYPLNAVLREADQYFRTTGRKVMYEYVLLNGVNDTEECALKLAALMKSRPAYFLNLINYNETGSFSKTEQERIENFKVVLKKEKINFGERWRFGDNSDAACGQLATLPRI